MCKGDLEALIPHRALGVGDHTRAGHGGVGEIERKFRSSQQGLERDFEVESWFEDGEDHHSGGVIPGSKINRSEEHTSELQSRP